MQYAVTSVKWRQDNTVITSTVRTRESSSGVDVEQYGAQHMAIIRDMAEICVHQYTRKTLTAYK